MTAGAVSVLHTRSVSLEELNLIHLQDYGKLFCCAEQTVQV